MIREFDLDKYLEAFQAMWTHQSDLDFVAGRELSVDGTTRFAALTYA